jgi:hypothetical protein
MQHPPADVSGQTAAETSLAGMMRDPMRRTGTYTALSAAAAWSFNRPSDRCCMRAVLGSASHQQQSEPGLHKPD